jgi:hypothetical protein
MPPITLNGDTGITTPMYNGSITANAVTPSVNMKNRIINGAMVLDQRNAGASVTIPAAATTYVVDRFFGYADQASKFSMQQNAGSVTAPVGFINYLGVTSLSAYSPTSSEVFIIGQPIEGLNILDLGWGTANAKTVTLSFWVRSSLTGSFSGSLRNSAADRSYPFSYTISSANTWEQKTVTIAGDTTGTWLTTNGIGIRLVFNLGSGSATTGTAGAWAASGAIGVNGSQSIVGTNGATFYITGVQLEVGSTATSFDYRPYTTELQLCQRYYYQHAKGTNVVFALGANYSSTYMTSFVSFPVTMRAAPTLVVTTGTNFYAFYRNGAADNFDSLTFGGGSLQGGELFNNTEISGTAGQGGFVTTANGSSSIAFQIEL